MTERVHHHEDLVFSSGTQVVALREVVGPGGRILHPRGSVGVVVKSPNDLDHSYRIRFLDGVEETLRRDEVVMLARYKEDEIGDPLVSGSRSELHDRVIFRCVIGSRAYGLEDEQSDVDYRGIFLPPADWLGSFPKASETADFHSPLCVGWRRPMVLLPTGWQLWPQDHLRAALSHELAHIGRGDVAWQLLARIACAFYWMHPLIWVAARRMRVERETACDDCVLEMGESPVRYARLLLRLAAEVAQCDAGSSSSVALAMATTVPVERRIRAILRPDLPRRPIGRHAGSLLALATAAVMALAGVTNFFGPSDIRPIRKFVVAPSPMRKVVSKSSLGREAIPSGPQEPQAGEHSSSMVKSLLS